MKYDMTKLCKKCPFVVAERLRMYDHTKLDMSVETVTVNSWLR